MEKTGLAPGNALGQASGGDMAQTLIPRKFGNELVWMLIQKSRVEMSGEMSKKMCRTNF